MVFQCPPKCTPVKYPIAKLIGTIINKSIKEELQKEYVTEDNVTVELAMRYGNPSIESALDKLKSQNFDSIVVVPLYPHYAASSTGTVMEEVMRIVSKWWAIPEIKFVGQFLDMQEGLPNITKPIKNHTILFYLDTLDVSLSNFSHFCVLHQILLQLFDLLLKT